MAIAAILSSLVLPRHGCSSGTSHRYMVVDRLFAAAELRLGDKRSEQRVRIVRDGAEPRRRGR